MQNGMSEGLDSIGLPAIGDFLVDKARQACGHNDIGLVILMHDNVSGKVVCITNMEPGSYDHFLRFVTDNEYTTEKHEFPPHGKVN